MQGRGYKAQPRTAFMIKSLILNPEADPCIGCCYQPTASTMDMAMDDGVQGHYGDTMTTPSTANVDTTRCQTGIYVVVVGRELSDGRRGRTMPGRYDFCSVFFYFFFSFPFCLVVPQGGNCGFGLNSSCVKASARSCSYEPFGSQPSGAFSRTKEYFAGLVGDH